MSEDQSNVLYSSPVSAGFPSFASDVVEDRLNLHSHIVKNEIATFFLRASGDSMLGAGIHHNDLLVVDRSLDAANNKIVIVALDGELTVKRLVFRKNKVFLCPENPNYNEIEVTNFESLHVWGVVTYVIHKL